METDAIVTQILETWRRHNEILLYLLDAIPSAGLVAVPAGSRGRDVARQFEHLRDMRVVWLHYHRTGVRLKMGRRADRRPTRAQLRKALRDSGREVDLFLEQALRGDARVRMFGGRPVQWLGYLIAHESHHRGQIMLALKQSGLRLPDEVAIEGLWGRWRPRA
jgi:uncharacterized damage-inducible protein DinB